MLKEIEQISWDKKVFMKTITTLLLIKSLIFFIIITPAAAQQKFTISGTVISKTKGETIIAATVKAGNHTTISNDYGFYSLTVDKGEYTVEVTAVGFQPFSQKIIVDQNQSLNISLEDMVRDLDEVIVSSNSRNRSLSSPQMGVEKLTTKEIKYVPVIFGEKDILKVVQLLPGVKAAGDGNSGFYVRGGAADQNLISTG